MRKKLRIFLLIFTILSIFSSNMLFSFASDKPDIYAESAIVIDYDSGNVLYEKNADKTIYPASTTKIWTAYLVLNHAKDLDDVVTVIKEDLEGVEGSVMGLKVGDSFSVGDLLKGLMLNSGNDSANVLARYISGSKEEFAKLMTAEAKKIGANNTNFTNPHGLPDELHMTTAKDMMLMARLAMNNDKFTEIVKSKDFMVNGTDIYKKPKSLQLKNTNQFLNGRDDVKYDIVDGIKTGFTNDAGRCLVSTAKKDNMRVICGAFKSDLSNLYTDSRNLIDYGFTKYNKLVDTNSFLESKKFIFSKEKNLYYYPKNNYSVVNLLDYEVKEVLNKMKLPISKGATVGNLEIYKNDKLITKIPLISKNELNPILIFSNLNIGKVFLYLCLISFLIVVVFLGFTYFYNKRYRSIYSSFSSISFRAASLRKINFRRRRYGKVKFKKFKNKRRY